MTKKTLNNHSLRFSTHVGRHGESIARVRLKSGIAFEITTADWHRVRRDFGESWFLASNGEGRQYLRAARRGIPSPITLARAVVLAGPGEGVRFRDGNPLNLRRENLMLTRSGRARHLVPDGGYEQPQLEGR